MMNRLVVLMAFTVIFCGMVIHDVYAVDDITIYEQDVQDDAVVGIVGDAISIYDEHGNDAWSVITPLFNIHTNDLYVFVFDRNTWETVAHGAIPDRVGHIPYSIFNTGDKGLGTITHELQTDGYSWVEYVFTNPGTGTPQYKRTYLQVHDGYIFGSGYYLPDARVQSVIDGMIARFNEEGTASFDDLPGGDGATFGVVLNRTDTTLVGIGVTGVWLNGIDGLPVEADRPMIKAWHEVLRDGRAWLERVTNNTATGTEQAMRQLWQVDGDYVYISGYYLPDAGAQSAVDQAVAAYNLHGDNAFGLITPEEPPDIRDGYAFILDGSGVVLAHGADPAMNGRVMPFPANASSGWLHHDDTKRTWLYHHDGYVFGSSYDIRDSQVQAVVRNMVHLDNAGEDVAWMVNNLHESGVVMPFVLDLDGTYLGHPGFRTGLPSGLDIPEEDGTGIWDGSTWLYRSGGMVFGGVHATR